MMAGVILSLTSQALASNAFRVLGLSGEATQADIDAAARRMRIWNDPAAIPPTPWDTPMLGPLARDAMPVALSSGDVMQHSNRFTCGLSRTLASGHSSRSGRAGKTHATRAQAIRHRRHLGRAQHLPAQHGPPPSGRPPLQACRPPIHLERSRSCRCPAHLVR